MSERDFEASPYTAEERRVCDYLTSLSEDIGCGDDPVGFLIASHNAIRRQKAKQQGVAMEIINEHAAMQKRIAFQRKELNRFLDAANAKEQAHG